MAYRDVQLANELREKGQVGSRWRHRRPDVHGFRRVVLITSIELTGEVRLLPDPAVHPTTKRKLNRSYSFARTFLATYEPVDNSVTVG